MNELLEFIETWDFAIPFATCIKLTWVLISNLALDRHAAR